MLNTCQTTGQALKDLQKENVPMDQLKAARDLLNYVGKEEESFTALGDRYEGADVAYNKRYLNRQRLEDINTYAVPGFEPDKEVTVRFRGTKNGVKHTIKSVKDFGNYVELRTNKLTAKFNKGQDRSVNFERDGKTTNSWVVIDGFGDAVNEVKQPVKGSDENVGIGDTDTDVFITQEEADLGQVLSNKYLDLVQDEVDAGQIPKHKIKFRDKLTENIQELENQIMEYRNKGKEEPKELFAEYEKVMDELEKDENKLNEFDELIISLVNTYEETMQNLGTGNVKLTMFENMVDNTAGQIDMRTKEMHIRWNKMSRLTRVSEVFLHEINHLMSSHVFKDNIKLRRLMEDLRNSAIDSGLTYELFLKGVKNPTPEEIKIAKMKFEYTFDKTADVEEFYAYATTNENVYNAIKDIEVKTPLIKVLKMDSSKKTPMKKVLNALIKSVNQVWRTISGRGIVGGKMLANMIQTIAKLDAEKVQRDWQSESAPDGITNYAKGRMNQLDEAIKPAIDKVEAWSEKLKIITSGKGLAKHIKKIPALNDLVETGVSQYLWRMVTQDTTSNDVADMYMIFRHAKQAVEKPTAAIRDGVQEVAAELYKNVDADTKNAVTRVILEADLAQFTAEEIKEYLIDGTKIDEAINQLIVKIEPEVEMLAQIDGLAEYLVSGKTLVRNQQINANNIVSELYKTKDRYRNANKEMVKLVDKLVSLKALQKSDATQLELLSKLDNELLNKTITMYRGYIDNIKLDATLGAYDPIQKGYARTENGLIKYELIPEEEVKAQQSVLMSLVEKEPYVIVEGKNYYLMTGRTKSVGFNEGAIGLISHTIEGIPVSSLIRKNNTLLGKVELMDGELKRKTRNIINAISNGDKDILKKFVMGEGKTLVPVYNHQNKIIDYRVQLNKLEKEIHLSDRKTGLEEVLSHTFSRSIKTTLTVTENKRVVDMIIENSAKGIEKDPDDYVLVEEYTEEDRLNGVKYEKRHERWEYLPDHTKDYIVQRINKYNRSSEKHKGIPIHKDFVELMTGEKDTTIGNFAKYGIDLKKYPVARARLMALESYLAEILKYVKNAMVVLNADVLLGNQTSNAIIAITHGIDPITYAKKFKERWQELNSYNEKIQQLAVLEVKKMTGENVNNKIAQLKKQLENNIWDELVKDGQYTTLVEGIDVEGQGDGQLLTMVNDYLKKKNWYNAIKTVRNVLYIDRTSALYNTMAKTVHYGDALTRQIIKEELEVKLIARRTDKLTNVLSDASIAKLRKLSSPNEAIKELQILLGDKDIDPKFAIELEKEIQDILNYLDQLLVNYGYTMNRWWKYAERVGGLFFMQYYLSQAKAIMSLTKENPTKTMLMQGAQFATGVDVQDPFDTYFRSGIDGIKYRWMLDDAPGEISDPNIFDLIPDISSVVRVS